MIVAEAMIEEVQDSEEINIFLINSVNPDHWSGFFDFFNILLKISYPNCNIPSFFTYKYMQPMHIEPK